MNNLRLSSSASITLTDVGVLLRSDLGTFQLTGSDLKVFISKIVPMLDGMLTKEEIADALPGYERGSIFQVLDLLLQTGLVEVIADQQESRQRWRGQHEFFRKWTSQPEEAIQKLQSARILIVGLEPWGVVVASELASAGVATIHLIDDGIVSEDDLLSVRIWDSDQLGRSRREALQGALGRLAPWCRVTIQPLHLDDNRQILVDGTNWNLVIVTTTGDDLMVLRAVALYAQRTSLMSLYGSLEGMEAVVGPAVIPGRTPCWNCTRLRLLANSDIPEPAHALQASLLQQRSQPRIRTYLAPMPPLLGHFLATEAIKLITEYTPSRLVGKLLIQNLIDLETSYHSVIRMPWCEVCGSSDRDAFRAGGTVLDDLTEESAIDIGKKN